MVLLTNFVPPYRIPVFLELQRRLKQFRVLISTRMEADRPWNPEAGGIDVVVQRSFTRKTKWNQPRGFSERTYLHFPYDTIAQLIRYRPDVIISGEFGFRTLNSVFYRFLFRRTRLIVWATISEDTERYRSQLRVAVREFICRHVAGAGFAIWRDSRFPASAFSSCPRPPTSAASRLSARIAKAARSTG